MRLPGMCHPCGTAPWEYACSVGGHTRGVPGLPADAGVRRRTVPGRAGRGGVRVICRTRRAMQGQRARKSSASPGSDRIHQGE